MVFAGYGVVSDELKRDDLAGIDVKGKIVVLLGGKPANVNAAVWQKLRADEVLLERLAKLGAVGFVFVHPGNVRAKDIGPGAPRRLCRRRRNRGSSPRHLT